MMYIVRWYTDESPIATYKKYSRYAAAVKFANKLTTSCMIDHYTDDGEIVKHEHFYKMHPWSFGDPDE